MPGETPSTTSKASALAEQSQRWQRSWVEHNGVLFAFDLSWQLVPKGQKLSVQSQALAEGYTHQVVGNESDLIGFLALPAKPREKRPIYSAALLLSETVSLGGDEVFAFRLDESRHALVALNNSMPVPGFDLVGDALAVAEAASQYLGLPHKSEVRRCGDADLLPGAEPFDFGSALAALDRGQPRLGAIPNIRQLVFRGAMAAVLVLVLVLGWAGWAYHQAQEEAARLQRENDPNVLYEQGFARSAPSVKGLGTPGFKAMVDTLKGLPVAVGGWGLSSVACKASECVATWVRQSGNFADFDAHLPPDVQQKPAYGFIGSDIKGTQLQTRHPVVAARPEAGSGLRREALPVVAEVQADFVSRLQDYSLIDVRVQVEAPAPFPSGVSDIGPVFKPVVSGTWSMELPLWTMDSIAFPDYVQVESLSLDVAVDPGASKSLRPYKLTGKYYAKGKVF